MGVVRVVVGVMIGNGGVLLLIDLVVRGVVDAIAFMGVEHWLCVEFVVLIALVVVS